jgi:hypothetical protein
MARRHSPRVAVVVSGATAGLLLASLALAGGFDLSMPVRTGDRIDGHYVWSVEGLGPDSLNDAGEVPLARAPSRELPQKSFSDKNPACTYAPASASRRVARAVR